MPLFFWVAWAWIKSIWQVTLAPLLAKVPWQVWAGLAVVVAFFIYGGIRERQGSAKCYAQVEQVKNAEVKRQQSVTNNALANANKEKDAAVLRASELRERLEDAQKDIAKLEDANKVCLPRSVTDKFRGVRSVPKGTGSSRSKPTTTPSRR